MRVPRLVAMALWLTVALLAVAGFAAFSPESAPVAATTTTVDPPTRGDAVGAVLGRALTAGMAEDTTSTTSPSRVEEAALDALRSERHISPPPTSVTTTTILPSRSLGSERLSVEEARSLIALFFKPQDVDTALRIAKCESTLNPNAVNGSSHASGLFQHLPRYWKERSQKAGWVGADIFDPYANTAVAAWLKYHAGGWSHWTCWNG